MKRFIAGLVGGVLIASGVAGIAPAAQAGTTFVYNGSFQIIGYSSPDTGSIEVKDLTAVDGNLVSGSVIVHATPSGKSPADCMSNALSGTTALIASSQQQTLAGGQLCGAGTIDFSGVGTSSLNVAGMSLSVYGNIIYGTLAPGQQPVVGTLPAPVKAALDCSATLDYPGQRLVVSVLKGNPDAATYEVSLAGTSLPTYTIDARRPIPFELVTDFDQLTMGTPISASIVAKRAIDGAIVADCTPAAVTPLLPGAPSIEGGIVVPQGGTEATVNYSVANPEAVRGIEYQLDGRGTWLRPGGSAPTSGAGGSFTLTGLTEGKHTIQLWSVGYGINAAPTKGTPEGFTIRLAIKPGTGASTARPSQGTAIGSTTAKPVAAPPAQPVSTVVGTSNGAGTGTNGALAANTGDAGIDAPCLAKDGTLYPNQYSTVGSQLTMAPNTRGMGAARSFIVTAGALPPGVQLDRSFGVLYGVTTAAGSWVTTVQATFADGSTKSSQFTTRVDTDPQTLQYAAQNIGVVGSRVAIAASTNAPVTGTTYKIVCGELPAGTKFDSRTGTITGTPTAVDLMPTPLRVAETNASGKAAASFLFVVQKTGFTAISYPAHPHLRVGRTARIQPTVNGVGEIALFRMWKGKLQRGLRLNPTTGVITGKPVNPGPTHTITIVAVTKGGALLTAAPMKISTKR